MINIRKVKETESALLQDLNNEVFIDNAKYDDDIIPDWAYSEQGKRYFQELVTNQESICFVAEDKDGKLVGYIAAYPRKYSYRKSRYLELDNMGVISQYRSQGIGEDLIKAFLRWASENGFQKVTVSSYSKNEKAIRFYKKCGFELIDVSLERVV